MSAERLSAPPMLCASFHTVRQETTMRPAWLFTVSAMLTGATHAAPLT